MEWVEWVAGREGEGREKTIAFVALICHLPLVCCRLWNRTLSRPAPAPVPAASSSSSISNSTTASSSYSNTTTITSSSYSYSFSKQKFFKNVEGEVGGCWGAAG